MRNLGQTRSANRRDHLLLTPDTFVRTPLPGLTGGFAMVHVGPPAGAAFTMMTVELNPVGTLTQSPAQRFLYLLEGDLTLSGPGTITPHKLFSGSYAFLPSGSEHMLIAKTKARVVVIDKPFQPLLAEHAKATAAKGENDQPWFLVGREQEAASIPLNGDEDLQVRSLLPDSLAFDFAVNTMTYAQGAALSQVEIHYMEHGLLMLDGGGIYRLGDSWYPTTTGDFIWMAPFCSKWFGTLGKQPAKYLIYKDSNRHMIA